MLSFCSAVEDRDAAKIQHSFNSASVTAPSPNLLALVQHHAAPDVSRHVEVFAFVNRRLTFLEATLGDYLQRQLALAHFRGAFARPSTALPRHELLHLLRRHYWRCRHEAVRRSSH